MTTIQEKMLLQFGGGGIEKFTAGDNAFLDEFEYDQIGYENLLKAADDMTNSTYWVDAGVVTTANGDGSFQISKNGGATGQYVDQTTTNWMPGWIGMVSYIVELKAGTFSQAQVCVWIDSFPLTGFQVEKISGPGSIAVTGIVTGLQTDQWTKIRVSDDRGKGWSTYARFPIHPHSYGSTDSGTIHARNPQIILGDVPDEKPRPVGQEDDYPMMAYRPNWRLTKDGSARCAVADTEGLIWCGDAADIQVSPSSSALFDCPANFIAEFHVTVEDTNAVTSHQRYVTADDYGVGFTIDVNRQIWLIEKPGGSYSDLWAGPTLNDAEHYRIRLEVTGSTAKLYIDDELKTTKTTSGNFTETGGIINHVLATNDIKIVTESNPKAPGLIVADGTGAYADEDIYWTDPSGSAFSIASGAAMLLTMTGWEMPSTLRMGLDDSLTSPVFGNAAWNCVGPDVQADAGSAPDVIDDLVSGVERSFMVIQRSDTHGYHYLDHQGGNEWKLNWSNEGVRTGGGSVYPGFGNYRFSFSLKRVALLDLSSWVERDFAEEHYHEVAPVYDTEHYLDADFHYRVIFERQTPGLLQLRFRRVDDDNHIHAYVDTSGNLRVNEVLDAGLNEIGRVNGVFTATVTYQMDVVVLGESIKVYVDNVLKISTTSTYLLTQAGAAAGAALCNYAVRTDEWWAHPHPALGLAIERWIAPRAADIDTGMPPDLLIQTRKLELPAGAENYLFRGTSITSPYCYAAGWESTGEANCREYDGDTNPQRVYGGPGTVADEDDHMARIDGAYLEVFVNSVSIGSYGSAIYQEQQGANNYPTAAVAADAIEFWPPRPQLPFSL